MLNPPILFLQEISGICCLQGEGKVVGLCSGLNLAFFLPCYILSHNEAFCTALFYSCISAAFFRSA